MPVSDRAAPPLPPPPDFGLPAAGRVTSPLWRIWGPLVVASVLSGFVLAWWGDANGGADVPVTLRLADVSREAGFTTEQEEPTTSLPTPSTLGAGVVVFDFDRDGDFDVFAIGGGPWPWEETAGRSRGVAGRLFRNEGRGAFTDVSMDAGITPSFLGMAAAAGDFDRDGWPDLIVTGVEGLALYRNEKDGTFKNVTLGAGLPALDRAWRTGATWIDINHDGWLDLIVMTYARWPEEVGLEEALDVATGGRTYGTPTGFYSTPPDCYLNQGDGTFSLDENHGGLEVLDPETRQPRSWGIAAVPIDANADAWPDLLLTYSQGAPALFLARADGFRRVAIGSELRREGDAFWQTRAPGGDPLGLDPRSHALLHWAWLAQEGLLAFPLSFAPPSLAAVDLDRDGRIEAVVAGPAAEPAPRLAVSENSLQGRPDLVRETGRQWAPLNVQYTSPEQAPPPATYRAAVAADLDGDGDEDLLLTRWGGPPVLLRNEARTTGPWLGVSLEPVPGQASFLGARVDVYTPRGVLSQRWLPRQAGLAQAPELLVFPLAEDTRVRRIVVTWPEGRTTELREPQLNRVNVIRP